MKIKKLKTNLIIHSACHVIMFAQSDDIRV